MPLFRRRNITPSAAYQFIRIGEYQLNIVGDADLVAENIDSGKNIFGVDGNQALAINGVVDVQATYDGTIAVNDIVYLYLNGATLHAAKSSNLMTDVDLGTSGIGYAKQAGTLNQVKTVGKIWG